MKKRDFKKPDRVSQTYDRKELQLHGKMDHLQWQGAIVYALPSISQCMPFTSYYFLKVFVASWPLQNTTRMFGQVGNYQVPLILYFSDGKASESIKLPQFQLEEL